MGRNPRTTVSRTWQNGTQGITQGITLSGSQVIQCTREDRRETRDHTGLRGVHHYNIAREAKPTVWYSLKTSLGRKMFTRLKNVNAGPKVP